MKRCIRESIKELSEHPQISKELLFLESEKGDKGFELIKKGKTIVGIKFLFRWLKLSTVDEFNQHDALLKIKELELKRINGNERLTDAELEILAMSYRNLGKEEHALKVEQSLARRHREQKEQHVSSQTQEIDDLLDKIDTLLDINDNPDY
jgi:hypothetical protein